MGERCQCTRMSPGLLGEIKGMKLIEALQGTNLSIMAPVFSGLLAFSAILQINGIRCCIEKIIVTVLCFLTCTIIFP